MFQIIVFILIGLVGGVIGGMGMGGGTLLIPLLTIFTDVEQHVAQAINLIAFIPMSIIAIIIHIKNKLIDYKYVIFVAIPAAIFSVGASLIANLISGKHLGRYFGIFLIILGLYQLACIVYGMGKKKGEKNSKIKQNEVIEIENKKNENLEEDI